ncbi:LysR substrate-binding domain-containing protein [Devosia neptuniae]
MPRALQIFTQSGVSATVRVITGPNAYLLSLLRSGDVDLVIGRMAEPGEIAGLSFEHLYSEKIAFVVGPAHPLLSVPDFTLSMIGQYPVLMPPPGAVILPTVERLLATHGDFAMSHLIETVSDSFARSFLRLTKAVWIISEGVVVDDIDEGHFRLLPVDTGQPWVRWDGPLRPIHPSHRQRAISSIAFAQR